VVNRDRELAGRVGALKSWANTIDKTARTRPARDKFLERFEREVDPEGNLPEKERAERALFARRAHMTALARRSAQARREKTLARKGEAALDDHGCAVTSAGCLPFAGQGADEGQVDPRPGRAWPGSGAG
jgi:hypothetical protein